jgi:hypothetical protein
MPLSDRTRAALVECIAGSYSHSDLDVLFLRVGASGKDRNEKGDVGNKVDRVNRVVAWLSQSK